MSKRTSHYTSIAACFDSHCIIIIIIIIRHSYEISKSPKHSSFSNCCVLEISYECLMMTQHQSKQAATYINWYSFWNRVVFDWCGLSIFCTNTQNKFQITNSMPPVIYEHEFEWSLRTPWWCMGTCRNWGMASLILNADTTSSVRSASCCGRFNVVPTEQKAGRTPESAWTHRRK